MLCFSKNLLIMLNKSAKIFCFDFFKMTTKHEITLRMVNSRFILMLPGLEVISFYVFPNPGCPLLMVIRGRNVTKFSLDTVRHLLAILSTKLSFYFFYLLILGAKFPYHIQTIENRQSSVHVVKWHFSRHTAMLPQNRSSASL